VVDPGPAVTEAAGAAPPAPGATAEAALPVDAASLYRTPNALAPSYSRFRVAERLLLTGHSHQAWPDCGLAGQLRAWEDAAEHLDGKWERAFARADRVRAGFARLLGDGAGEIALGASTHDLLVRFLSALPLRERPRLVTTDAEFHSARRQLARLAEEGIELARVPADPAESVGERLAAAVDDHTAACLVSTVFFTDAQLAGGLDLAAQACARHGAELLLDAYHQLNVVPLSLASAGFDGAFVVGGGYKYCQLGEGCCFLRLPPGCRLRPVITGWYAEFARLAAQPDGTVAYPAGAWRFAGSTYDPTSHYRGAEVFDFFAARGLHPALLREVSQHQVGLLCRAFDELDLPERLIRRDRTVPLERLGGFLALRSPRAGEVCAALRAAGVLADSRADVLRLGPAPYLADGQLAEAMARLGEVVRGLRASSPLR
jgi:kynureninase